MNASLISLEFFVIALGLVLMLADVFVPVERRRFIGYAAIAALAFLFATSLVDASGLTGTAFHGAFVNDGLALFFKRLFIVAAILVLFIAIEFSDRIARRRGILFPHPVCAGGDAFCRIVQRLSRCCSSPSNSSPSRFTSSTSFQRVEGMSLEAGVKYLILGALSSAFMVFGIALIWGTTGKLNFNGTRGRGRRNMPTRKHLPARRSCSWWSASASRSPPFRSRFGRRMFIKARPRPQRPFLPSAPRRPALSCCSACCSPPCPL